VSNEAAFLSHEINKQFPQRDRSAPNPQRATRLADILETLPGAPFVCPPGAIAAAEPLFADDLRWLRGVLGEQVFSERPEKLPTAPRWEGDTLSSIAVLINDLARAR
jgi:hypothetical protein